MTALAARLETIPGLRTALGFPNSISPPVAVVGYPDVRYDLTMRRGGDTLLWEVTLVVGKATERGARVALLPYLRPSGTSSVKEAVDGDVPGVVDFFRVVRARPAQEFAFDNVNYLGVIFEVESVVSWTG